MYICIYDTTFSLFLSLNTRIFFSKRNDFMLFETRYLFKTGITRVFRLDLYRKIYKVRNRNLILVFSVGIACMHDNSVADYF